MADQRDIHEGDAQNMQEPRIEGSKPRDSGALDAEERKLYGDLGFPYDDLGLALQKFKNTVLAVQNMVLEIGEWWQLATSVDHEPIAPASHVGEEKFLAEPKPIVLAAREKADAIRAAVTLTESSASEWIARVRREDPPAIGIDDELSSEEWRLISCIIDAHDYRGDMSAVDEHEKNLLLASVENQPCDGLIVIAVQDGRVLECHTSLTRRQRALALASVLDAVKKEA